MAKLFGTNAQIRPIQQTAIQPTGLPGSTFIRPVQREVGSNATRLAEALGGLNSALQNFATVRQAEKDDPASRANKEQIARLSQMNKDQLAAEIAAGSLDGRRAVEDAAQVLLAERSNDDLRTQWPAFYNTDFDRTNGNAEEEFERMRQEIAAALPSEIARGHFYRLSGDYKRAWMEKDVEEKTAYVKGEITTTVVKGFRAAIDDAIGINGKTPEEAARIVFEKSASNRVFLGMSGREQNETILAIAAEYALKGDEAMARALLEGERVGADGRTVPALLESGTYATKGLQLLEQAAAQRDQVWARQNLDAQVADNELIDRGAFNKVEADKRRGQPGYPDDKLARMVAQSENNLQSIRNKAAAATATRERERESARQEHDVIGQAYAKMQTLGGINDIEDVEIDSPTGEGKITLTAERIKAKVVSRFEDQMDDEQENLVAQGAAPEEARKTIRGKKLAFYSVNRIENREWTDLLNGIAGRASTEGLLERGDAAKKLAEDAELYRELRAANPAYLSTLLSDTRSKDFLESYANSVENRRMPPEEALHSAAVWAAQDERTKAGNIVSRADAETMAESLLKGIDADIRGPAFNYVLGRIQDISANGATKRETQDLLKKELEDTTVVINGVMVLDNNDLPDDFPALVEKQLASTLPMLKDYGIEDVEDLFIVPVSGQSKWAVYSKRNGFLNTGIYITPQSLKAERAKAVREQENLTRKMLQAADAERAAYKAEYDASIAADRKEIERWSKRTGFMSKGIAKRLRENLERRLARDAELMKTTPRERADKHFEELRKRQEENFKDLGFGDRFSK